MTIKANRTDEQIIGILQVEAGNEMVRGSVSPTNGMPS